MDLRNFIKKIENDSLKIYSISLAKNKSNLIVMQIDSVASLYSFKTAYLNSKLRKQKGEVAVGAEILPSFTRNTFIFHEKEYILCTVVQSSPFEHEYDLFACRYPIHTLTFVLDHQMCFKHE